MGNKSIKTVWSNVMTNYLEKYKKLCAELTDATNKEEVKQHNKAMKKLAKLFYEVEKQEDKSFFMELLEDENPRTNTLVAAHCLGLGVYEKEAKSILKRNSKIKDNPTVAFNAETTLEVYRNQGYLKF